MTEINRNIQKSVLTQALSLGIRLGASVLLARILGLSARGEVALMNHKGYHQEQMMGNFNALALIAIAVGALVYVIGAQARALVAAEYTYTWEVVGRRLDRIYEEAVAAAAVTHGPQGVTPCHRVRIS